MIYEYDGCVCVWGSGRKQESGRREGMRRRRDVGRRTGVGGKGGGRRVENQMNHNHVIIDVLVFIKFVYELIVSWLVSQAVS